VRVLLDTNIIIHREAATAVKEDIGVLFRWLDHLHYEKCIHPVSIAELMKHEDPKVIKSIQAKLGNYSVLKTSAPLAAPVRRISDQLDKNQNDFNDTQIINELFNSRVDMLITEDSKILHKCRLLGLTDIAYTIDTFLEKVTAENPELADYKVLAVKKDYLGNFNIADDFFEPLEEDYPGFVKWFNKKANEPVYVCQSEGKLIALLYLKVEGDNEDYSDIEPELSRKKRLKIGTFRVSLNGFRLGERFIKIAFDNAIRFNVDEIYVTTQAKRIEQQRLINLLIEFGFQFHGYKHGPAGEEYVLVRSLYRAANRDHPTLIFPFFSKSGQAFIVPIYPAYHTNLFPDSILRTESPEDFVENEPHRNAISKVYISRSIERNLHSGDVIVLYRTGGYYVSVVTTIGIVEGVIDNILSEAEFMKLCRKRSVFSNEELSRQWNKYPRSRPFIVNCLYAYSLPKRINMKRLIEIGVIPSVDDAPRGFTKITGQNLLDILKECQANESIVVD
jgi:predicted nucleic acid-binding protein